MAVALSCAQTEPVRARAHRKRAMATEIAEVTVDVKPDTKLVPVVPEHTAHEPIFDFSSSDCCEYGMCDLGPIGVGVISVLLCNVFGLVGAVFWHHSKFMVARYLMLGAVCYGVVQICLFLFLLITFLDESGVSVVLVIPAFVSAMFLKPYAIALRRLK
jgi:hypothetical protein